MSQSSLSLVKRVHLKMPTNWAKSLLVLKTARQICHRDAGNWLWIPVYNSYDFFNSDILSLYYVLICMNLRWLPQIWICQGSWAVWMKFILLNEHEWNVILESLISIAVEQSSVKWTPTIKDITHNFTFVNLENHCNISTDYITHWSMRDVAVISKV